MIFMYALVATSVGGLFYWAKFMGNNPHWPKGERITERRGMVTVHIIVNDNVIWKASDLSKPLTLAVWSAVSQWIWMIHDKGWNEIEADMNQAKEVCVRILTDAEFDDQAWIGDIKSRDSIAYNTGAEAGDGIPMISIRESATQRTIDTGEPLIQEMVKILAKSSGIVKDVADYADGRLWFESGGSDSIQFHARKLYSDTAY